MESHSPSDKRFNESKILSNIKSFLQKIFKASAQRMLRNGTDDLSMFEVLEVCLILFVMGDKNVG